MPSRASGSGSPPTPDRIRSCRKIAAELREEAPAYAAPMPEMARKQRHYAASASLRMRTPDGKSMRHG